ncbi:MAG: OBAP family protein [Verrucomicrobia bacterium]|nr:OBAP family protein [Verrucomicrobiota bacterium]
MKKISSSASPGCGCLRRRHVLSGLAVTLAAATVSPLRRLFGQTPPSQQQQQPESTETKLMGMGSHLLQGKHPIDRIDAYVCGLHFYNGDLGRQVIAHHFCSHRSEEFLQCVIYDTNEPDARLIGIEYIISARLFGGLPEEEKRYWHSHQFEVKSGQLTAPGIPQPVEQELMKKLVNTYGKTWHTWQYDRYADLPLGVPQLMMGFTQEGQAQRALVNELEKGIGYSVEQRMKDRQDIEAAPVLSGANSWQQGNVYQVKA